MKRTLKSLKMGADAIFFCGDISEEVVLKEFTQKVVEHYNKIDFLINNACISKKVFLSRAVMKILTMF